MKHFFRVCIALFVLVASAGCEKADIPATAITCSLDLLNEQGQPATVFAQGQNIVFRFQMTNPSDQDIVLNNPPFDVTNFLEVNRLTSGEGSGALGKPYTNIFCTFQGGVVILAHTTTTLAIPWVEIPAYPTSSFFCGHAQTSHLPVGRYRTSFTTPLTILHVDQPDEVTASKTYMVDFEVR